MSVVYFFTSFYFLLLILFNGSGVRPLPQLPFLGPFRVFRVSPLTHVYGPGKVARRYDSCIQYNSSFTPCECTIAYLCAFSKSPVCLSISPPLVRVSFS